MGLYAVKKRSTPNARLANVANALSTRSADSVECSATEMCFSLANTPFYLDVTNSDFNDGVGTTGNALTGDYVLADGRKGNQYTGPYPQVTVGVAEAVTTGAGSAGGASETGAAGAGAGTTGSGAAASPPSATGAGASNPTATGSGSAATPSKNAAAGKL
jgi:hypothetical protein